MTANIVAAADAVRQSSYSAKRDGKTVARFGMIRREIGRARDSNVLKGLRQEYAHDWDTLPSAWAAVLDDDYDARMAVLTEAEGVAA